MRPTRRSRQFIIATALVVFAAAPALWGGTAAEIIQQAGVRGGLVVHVGCGDGRLTAALGGSERYVVHGLDTDADNVRRAREHIRSLGLYGRVAADQFDGKRLPYVGELVNLLVADELGGVSMDEALRVLAPGGVACIRKGDAWERTVKPRPADIDEWSHFLHDAGGNAVANDRRVGPPERLRWVAGPPWCRSHEFPSSVQAVVTAGGRIFTIFDEAPSGVFRKLPQQCSLIARDAFSGVLLWKAPLREWQPEFGTGTGSRWQIHHTIPRRLVSTQDRVYVTLQFAGSPVSVLDAATGAVLVEALEGTKGTDEMVLSDGVLIVKIAKGVSVGAMERIGKGALDDTLAAVDVGTGRQLWRQANVRVLPYALSAQAGRVVYHNMDELVCLDARSGKQLWRAPNPTGPTQGGVSTLVIADGVVLYHGNGQAAPAPAAAVAAAAAAIKAAEQPTATKARKKATSQGRFFLTALSLADGKGLWRHAGKRAWAGACTQPTDLFVTNGIVWCGALEGRDLHSGEVRKKVDVGEMISPGHHYRCHRSKATERYLILPKRGAEFVDVEGDNHMRHDWLRAPCFTGLTPANGLLYVPPSPCFCYPGAKVSGFLAMSAEPAEKLTPATDAHLHRGLAYGKVEPSSPMGNRKSEIGNGDWPCYRRDTLRSGSTTAAVPAELTRRWEIDLACRGTQPVIVGERLWVAEKDAHRIRCLSAGTGKDLWSFTAAGRIDSAPTIHEGLVLFGCRDGRVYCLRAADGELVWRFDAAPADRRTVSYEQVESLWPVQGSVLVQQAPSTGSGQATVYFAAGRSSFLDGGIVVYGLDARSGRVRHSHVLEGPRPDVTKDKGRPFAMEGALPDLLVSDGRDLYMQRIKFDAKLNRLPTTRESDLGELDMGADHLVASGGFLDDTGFDRLFWMHSHRWPGFYFAQHAPKAGQLVVFDDAAIYAVKYFYRRHVWSPLFIPAEQGYLLFADDLDNEPALDEKGQKSVAIDWLPEGAATDKYRRGGRGVEKGTGYIRTKPCRWQELIPLRIRAMVLARAPKQGAGGLLFAAGLPDVLDPADPLAAFEGRKGALLNVFSAADGSLLRSYPLSSPPAFDALSATPGRLFLATQDGKLVCYGGTP